MHVPTILVIDKKTGGVAVIDLTTLDWSKHRPLVPDVTHIPRKTRTKQERDREIAQRVYRRHR